MAVLSLECRCQGYLQRTLVGNPVFMYLVGINWSERHKYIHVLLTITNFSPVNSGYDDTMMFAHPNIQFKIASGPIDVILFVHHSWSWLEILPKEKLGIILSYSFYLPFEIICKHHIHWVLNNEPHMPMSNVLQHAAIV